MVDDGYEDCSYIDDEGVTWSVVTSLIFDSSDNRWFLIGWYNSWFIIGY